MSTQNYFSFFLCCPKPTVFLNFFIFSHLHVLLPSSGIVKLSVKDGMRGEQGKGIFFHYITFCFDKMGYSFLLVRDKKREERNIIYI